MIYYFDTVLSTEDIMLLKKHNLPTQCESNIDVLWETILKMAKVLPVSATERISDILQDNLED